MLNFARGNRSGKACAAFVASAASALVMSGGVGAAEPNNDFATATGPLTAGQTFKASLETIDDSDFQFFYLPDTTSLTVTTINDGEAKGGAATRGRTIVSSLLRARKGKLPEPIGGSGLTIKPGTRDSFSLSLLPGKYYIPVGHATTTSPALANIPFRLQIGPVGSTTSSFEIFESRCRAQQRKLDRIKSGIKRTKKHLSKAKKNDAKSQKIVKLKLKLRDKRANSKVTKKAEKFACSIPR